MNRRKILRSIGGGVAVGGLSTSMSRDSLAESTSPVAEAEVARAETFVKEFSDPETAQRSVRNHASGVIEGLRESDDVRADEAPTVTDIRPMTSQEFREHETGTLVRAVSGKNKTISAEITYKKPISSGHLTLITQPHFAESYAVLRHDDSTATIIQGTGEGEYTIMKTNLVSDRNTDYSTSSGCVAGAACRYYPNSKNWITELYCCYDSQNNCYDCYWGSKQEVCGQNCVGKSYCEADCYCGNC